MKSFILLTLVIVAVVFGAATTWSAAPLDDEICPTTIEQQLVDLINDIRADSGRDVLEIDRRLIVSSRRHANDMATNWFLSHEGSDGSTYIDRITDAGYPTPSGEVIAASFSSAEAAVNAWMGSDPHRAVLLSTYHKHMGSAYVYSPGGYTHYYTIDFGGATGDAVPHDCAGCCSGRVGDANSSGEDEPTLGDISTLIAALFISSDPDLLTCLEEADANQSGDTAPTFDDITLGDISVLIEYLFIKGPYDPVSNPTGAILLDCL